MLPRVVVLGCAGVLLTAFCATAHAQQRDTLPPRRDTIPIRRDTTPQRLAPVVTVTREAGRSPLDVPFAISTTHPDSARPGQRHVLLDETLFLLPGVTVANRNNPTQDPRVSIRGFGARSAFGVRGIRILRDGMPLTLADGSTPVDYLDLESVGSIEVIRGSAAALYGNASGGVIDVRTAPAPTAPFAAQARGWGGSAAYQRFSGIFGGTGGQVQYQGDLNYNYQDGSRDFSRQRVTSGYGKATFKAGSTDLAFQVLGFDMPLAENPGALTRAQIDSAPDMADPLSVLKQARKSVNQVQLGLQAHRDVLGGELNAQIYGGTRNLYNPLTFAIVDLGRASYGAGARLTVPTRLFGMTHRFTVGADAQLQNDLRKNFANCNGVTTPNPASGCTVPETAEEGAIQVNQREIVSGFGPYVRDEVALTDRYRLMLGARLDYTTFDVRDHLATPTGPNNSGKRTLQAVSPIVGFNARYTDLHSAYATISTSFETPTTTELANQPSGATGLNRDLKPQYSTTYELGLKGILLEHLRYDLAGFDTEVRDELIPYQIPGGSGRQFYRNAGRTRRRGIELGLSAVVGRFDVGASYTFAHYRFREFTVNGVDFAGNSIPGIPTNQLQLAATWRPSNFFVTVESVVKSSVWVDDANTATADGYGIVNLRLGATSLFGNPWIAPMLSIQNLFDKRYVGSVSVNASQGKFYEPAPGRMVYAGLTVAVGR
jgi:iron complex outermembrane receptor protein